MTEPQCSGIAHLEEIRSAGLEMPAVNQIEVGLSSITPPILLAITICTNQLSVHAAAPAVPAEANCRVLQKALHSRPGVLPNPTGEDG